MHVAISSASCKSRDERSIEREIHHELIAFRRGVRGERLRSTRPNLTASWKAGRRFAWQQARGLRPIDTIRRKGAQEAGRP